MKLGVDFDNTLVNYDGLFYRTGLETGWIPEWVGRSKQAVKSYLIQQNQEHRWTELQGIVYGETIKYASPYPGSFDTLNELKTSGAALFLVSHKTQYPIIGKKRDFHQAAQNWLVQHGFIELFDAIYFCPEKDTKIQKITDLQLDAYIDDLPDILMHRHFPPATQRVLFDSGKTLYQGLLRIEDWRELLTCLR